MGGTPGTGYTCSRASIWTRLNGAVIKGFEKDVGNKTSFYGFTVNTMKNSLISYWNFGFTSVPQGPVRLLMGMALSRAVRATVPRGPPPRADRGPHPGDGEAGLGACEEGRPGIPGGTGPLWSRAWVAGAH